MDTEILRWFQDVADGATVTEVSDVERVSQSGVSRAIARLEDEVGTSLFRRSGRTLRMTHAGVVFKRHVDSMMHQLDDGLAAVQQIIDPETGTVTLAYESWLGLEVLPRLVSGFRRLHPQVRFDLIPKKVENSTTVRARGDVDLELSTLRPPPSGFGWHHIARAPIDLIVPQDHPWAARKTTALAATEHLTYIAHSNGSLLRLETDALCAEVGLQPQVEFEGDTLSTVQGYVRSGLGVALVPSLEDGPGMRETGAVHLTLDDVAAVRDIGISWSRDRRLLPAAELFLSYVSSSDAMKDPPPPNA